MGAICTRRILIALSVGAAAAAGAAALPTVSPVAATSVAAPACTPPAPTTPIPGAPPELLRLTTPTGTAVLSGHSGGWSYRSLGCRNDGAAVATIDYAVLKAPKSRRWMAYATSIFYGNRGVAIDYAIPTTERQFDRLRKRNRARTEVKLPGVKGTGYVTRDQAPAFTLIAKKINGKAPTSEARAAAAAAILDAGDPFAD